MNPSEVTERRVYLGGLGESTREADLIDRFSPFGQVSSVSIASVDGSSSICRGFAHFTIRTSEAQWRRLLSALNGSSWKGRKLRIEEAQPDYQARLARERQELAVLSSSSITNSPARRIRRLVRHRSCGLMTDAQIGKRKGWKRSRYGRAVALIRVRRPDGKLITVDPAHFKDRIEKLFGSVRPLPVTRLTWTYDERCSSPGTLGNVGDNREEENDSSDQSEDEKPASSAEAFPEQSTNDQIEGLVEVKTNVESPTAEFSLSRLLGLEEVMAPQSKITTITPDVPHEPEPISSGSLAPAGPSLRRSPVVASLKDLLFDPAAFITRPIPLSEYAFCRRSGKEEAYVLWREARKNLRSDFKQRLKQAKRLSSRKPKKWA